MRHLHTFLLFISAAAASAAALAAIENASIEGVESLVVLNSPASSEETESDLKKAHLSFLDDVSESKPSKIEKDGPTMKYVKPEAATTPTFTTAATAAPTTQTAAETTEAAATTTVAATVDSTTATATTTETPTTTTEAITTVAATTAAAAEKDENEDKEVDAIIEPIRPLQIPIPLPEGNSLQQIVETTEPELDDSFPLPPKVSGVLTSQFNQGNPWGTEEASEAMKEKPSIVAEFAATTPVEIGEELNMGEISPFLPSDELLSDLPVISDKIEDKKDEEDGEMERAKFLMDALRAMKSEVDDTLRLIDATEERTTITESSSTVLPSTEELSTTELPTTTTTSTEESTTSTTEIPSTSTEPSTTTVPTATARYFVTTPRLTYPPRSTTSTTTTTTTTEATTTTAAEVEATTAAAAAADAAETTRRVERVEGATTEEFTAAPTTAAEWTTVQPLQQPAAADLILATVPLIPFAPIDEVKSTEAVQVDSEIGVEEGVQVIPNNSPVVVVDNTMKTREYAKMGSRRISGYTKTAAARIIDSDLSFVKKVYKRPHDNSFLPIDEGDFAKIPKQRHLIQNEAADDQSFRKRRKLRKRVKKRVTSPPPSATLRPLPLPSTTSKPLPHPTLRPSLPIRPVNRPAAVAAPPPPPHRPLIQVQPSFRGVQPVQQPHLQPQQHLQQQQRAAARAAPIFTPYYAPTVQPQYYPSPVPLQYQYPVQQQQQLVQFSPSPQYYPPQPQQQLPIIRYEPVVYYKPVYGRKKREAIPTTKKHSFLFDREEKKVEIRKGSESRFSLLHSVVSPSIRGGRRHNRVFTRVDQKPIRVKKVERIEEKEKKELPLPKSPVIRRYALESSSDSHVRTKRVKRSADLSEVNKELDALEMALLGDHIGDRHERHSGVDELASELEMIEKMKREKKVEKEEEEEEEENEEEEAEQEEKKEKSEELVETEDFDDDNIPEEEEEDTATAGYKRPLPDLSELKSLEDSVQVDHERMGKHPQGELRLNKGERPKLFSNGRTARRRHVDIGINQADYEYDAEIANNFHLPASDAELEQLYHNRERAAEFAPESPPTASPLRERRRRRRRHRQQRAQKIEVSPSWNRRIRKITREEPTTERPVTRSPRRRTRKPATIIPNFRPKEASAFSDSLASLPTLLPPFEETSTPKARPFRRRTDLTTEAPSTTTTEEPEETTTRRKGRPARILPKKESISAIPLESNNFFYDRDSAATVVTRPPPTAPPTLFSSPPHPTLSPSPFPTLTPELSVEDLSQLPRETLLEELRRLTDQLSARIEESRPAVAAAAAAAATVVADDDEDEEEDVVDEEDRELMDAINGGKKRTDPFEFLPTTTPVTTTTTEREEENLFDFALPKVYKGEIITMDDLILSDAVNEASIGEDLDKLLGDVGVGDNGLSTRKRAIEMIMEMKKRTNGVSKAKCTSSTCDQDGKSIINKEDYELVHQLQAVNMKHPLAKDGKFSLFATNKKSYYILPDGRVLVVNEKSKLARTNSGEDLHLDSDEDVFSIPEYPPDIEPTTRRTITTTTNVKPLRRKKLRKTTTAAPSTTTTTTPAATTTRRKKLRRPTTTAIPFPIEDSEYEEIGFESATVAITPKSTTPPPPPTPLMPIIKKVLLPWRTTVAPPPSEKKRVFIHDGGIEPSQVPVFAASTKAPLRLRDPIQKTFPARTLDKSVEGAMSREELIKYLESIDLAKTFGGKNIEEEIPNDDNFEKAVAKTAEEDYNDEVEYEDTVVEKEKTRPPASRPNEARSVDDIDLRQWFTIGKDSAAKRAKKGDGIAESILEAASEVPDEEVAEDEFLAEESVNLFPDDFVRVLRSVSGGDRVPMKMIRRLGLRLRAARLRKH